MRPGSAHSPAATCSASSSIAPTCPSTPAAVFAPIGKQTSPRASLGSSATSEAKRVSVPEALAPHAVTRAPSGSESAESMLRELSRSGSSGESHATSGGGRPSRAAWTAVATTWLEPPEPTTSMPGATPPSAVARARRASSTASVCCSVLTLLPPYAGEARSSRLIRKERPARVHEWIGVATAPSDRHASRERSAGRWRNNAHASAGSHASWEAIGGARPTERSIARSSTTNAGNESASAPAAPAATESIT
mmetsp:Transcript_32323/g.69454  ORF Transcript_32323/g.69454 Transcript_32323/m.69454 type:complete len:251 (-) Transcript_32323:94-846(-)